MKKPLLYLCLLLAASSASNAAIILFDLAGTGGSGLRTTNENPAASGTATGGELLGGITFDNVSNVLTINVGWGTANGFTNLTGNATAGHLHGAAGFAANAGVQYPLDAVAGWNPSATAGGFNGTITILAADLPSLLGGQLYINVHTSANPGGEIRGNLVQVPEPSASVMGLATLGLLTQRRRR
jgi:hypothetical protein